MTTIELLLTIDEAAARASYDEHVSDWRWYAENNPANGYPEQREDPNAEPPTWGEYLAGWTSSIVEEILAHSGRWYTIARADSVPGDSAPSHPRAHALIASRVARHWARAVMSWPGARGPGSMQVDSRVAAHPLSCVRAAIAGETDPVHLGVQDGRDARFIRRVAARYDLPRTTT